MRESIRISCGVSLSPFTTFGIGGKAKRLIEVGDADALEKLDLNGDVFVMGGGSNLLVGDGGFNGDVVRFVCDDAELRSLGDGAFYASGGSRLPLLSRKALSMSLSGLEWAAGIPGTLGGALKMNASAYDRSIGDVVEYADIFFRGKRVRLDRNELGLSYRSSEFDGIVLGAALRLESANPQNIAQSMESFRRKRRESQPSGKSAGCIYKAHAGIPAYRYISGARLAGLKRGDAVVSTKHANFIINEGNAQASDVLALMEEIERAVENEYGVKLTREVKLIGEF